MSGLMAPAVAVLILAVFVFLYRFFLAFRRGTALYEMGVLFILGLMVRGVAAVVVELWLRVATGTPFLFGYLGDDSRYYEAAVHMARRWDTGGFQVPAVLYTQGYEAALAVGFWLLGPAVWLGKAFGVAIGAAIAPAVYRLVRDLDGRESAWTAGVITALFPPLVFWSTLLYKDTLLTLALVVVLVSGMRFLSRGGSALVAVLSAAVGMGIVGAFRLQSVLIAALALSASAVANPVRAGRRRLLRNLARVLLPVGGALAGLFIFSSRYFAIGGPGLFRYLGLDRINTFYEVRSLAFQTTSAPVEGAFLSLPIQLIASFVLPLPLFVDVGSPWTATEHAMLAGNIIWLWLLYYALLGIAKADRRNWLNWLPLILVIVGTASGIAVRGYAMIYRHKVQMYPFVIIIASMAMVRVRRGTWTDEKAPRWLWGVGLASLIVLYNFLRVGIAAR